jgi:hypothetical protein
MLLSGADTICGAGSEGRLEARPALLGAKDRSPLVNGWGSIGFEVGI